MGRIVFLATACLLFSAPCRAEVRVDAPVGPQTDGQASADLVPVFRVYDEMTESMHDNFQTYHPYECRNFYARYKRSDGTTIVAKLRRCD
jgi:hypothetical protein